MQPNPNVTRPDDPFGAAPASHTPIAKHPGSSHAAPFDPSSPASTPVLRKVRGLDVHHVVKEDYGVYETAPPSQRICAFILDILFFIPLFKLVEMPFKRDLQMLEAFGSDSQYMAFALLIRLVPMFLYFVVPTMLQGQTLGKKVAGLRVIQQGRGVQLNPMQAVIRESVAWLTLGFGFVFVGLTSSKRALHDILSGTKCITYHDD